MDISSFINALRRFLAIRGPVIQLPSDCDTKNLGSCNELQEVSKPSDASLDMRHLLKKGCECIFSPPHASHTGRVWASRISRAKLLNVLPKHLTHQVLATAKALTIINASPPPPPLPPFQCPTIQTRLKTLLTRDKQHVKPPAGDFSAENLSNKRRKRVQHLVSVSGRDGRKKTFPRYNRVESGKTRPPTCRRAT